MGWRALGEEEADAEFLAADTGGAEKGPHPGAVGQERAGVVQMDLGFWGRIPGWDCEHLGLRNVQTHGW